MISLREFVSFCKKNKEAGIWLEGGTFRLHQDGCNGRSDYAVMTSSMFNFLYRLKIIKKNDYMGFKSVRTFPINTSLLKQINLKTWETEFLNYQNLLRKNLRKDVLLLEKVSGIKLSPTLKTTTEILNQQKIPVSIQAGSMGRYSGQTPSKIKIGGQEFTYFTWRRDYRTVVSHIQKRIDKLNEFLISEQVDEYVSVMDYDLAPLPREISKKLFDVFGYTR